MEANFTIRVRAIHSAVFILAVLFFSRNFTFLMAKEEGIGSSLLFQFFALLVYVYSFYLLVKFSCIRQFFYESMGLLLFVLLMFLSALWSDNPSKTFSRSIAMLGTLLFSYSMYKYFSHKELLNLIIIALGIGAYLSLFIGYFVPSLGVHDSSGNTNHIGLWKGVYGFKNHLGRFMAILMFCLLAVWYRDKFLSAGKKLLMAVAFFLVLKSGSSTAIILMVVCPVILVYANFLQSPKININYKAVSFFLCILIVFFAVTILPWVVENIFGKDMTGSGRTDLWVALYYASQNHMLGHGFGGVFWGEGSSAYNYLDTYSHMLGHAHNGFVDIWLEMGFLGLLIYTFIILKILFLGWYECIVKSNSHLVVFFIISIFLVLYSLSGGGFVKQNNLLWVLFCCSWFYLTLARNKDVS